MRLKCRMSQENRQAQFSKFSVSVGQKLILLKNGTKIQIYKKKKEIFTNFSLLISEKVKKY